MKGWAWLDVRGHLQEATSHLELSRSRDHGVHAFGVDSVLQRSGSDGPRQGLSAFNALHELAERHLKGSRKSCQMAKPDLARTAFKVGDVDLVNPRLFGEVDLPPTFLFMEFRILSPISAYTSEGIPQALT
jgi:hypothetical protein